MDAVPHLVGDVRVGSTLAAVMELCRAAERVAALEMQGVPAEDLLAMAPAMIRCRRAFDAGFAHIMSELEAQGATEIAFGMRTGAWLANETGESKTECSVRTRIAARLRTVLPLVDEALTDGRIGWEHAKVLHEVANPRIVNDMARLCPELIDLAGVTSFDRWRDEVRGLAKRLDQDGGYDPAGDESNNRIHLRDLPDGMVDVRGQLVGELAQRFRTLVEAETDRIWREHRNVADQTGEPTPPTSRAQYRAQALDRLLRRGAGVDLASTKPPVTEIVLVMHDDQPDLITNLDGHPLHPSILRALSCDGALRPLVIDRFGNPLWMGDRIRLANRQQRRALAIRDGGCAFPGCSCPASWTDAHHVVPFDPKTTNGTTDISNLALLCRFHHGVTHRRGWAMHATDDQWFWWTTPTGNTMWSQRHGRQRAGPVPVAA